MAAEYPNTGKKFFAHEVVRLMGRTCAAQEIGSDGFMLVTVIAHTEDAKRYSAPVTFWNEQLLSVLGFRSWNKLDRARKKAIAAGWLHYESGGKSQVGRYWVSVPDAFEGLLDAPVDEDCPIIIPAGEDDNRLSSSPEVKEPGDNRGTTGGQPGDNR